MTSDQIKISKPISASHKRGMLWFWGLLNNAGAAADEGDANDKLSRSRDFFHLYVETGEMRYLRLSDNFLKDYLKA